MVIGDLARIADYGLIELDDIRILISEFIPSAITADHYVLWHFRGQSAFNLSCQNSHKFRSAQSSFTRFNAVRHAEKASVPIISEDLLPALESDGNPRREFLPKRAQLRVGNVEADLVVDMILNFVFFQGSR